MCPFSNCDCQRITAHTSHAYDPLQRSFTTSTRTYYKTCDFTNEWHPKSAEDLVAQHAP